MIYRKMLSQVSGVTNSLLRNSRVATVSCNRAIFSTDDFSETPKKDDRLQKKEVSRLTVDTTQATKDMSQLHFDEEASLSEQMKTMTDVKRVLLKILSVDKNYTPKKLKRDNLLPHLPQSQAELPPRSIQDSFDSAIIPLASKPSLQNKYTTAVGTVRVGRLLEDLDLFAVWIALKHILNPKQPKGTPTPYIVVTGFVDRISFSDKIGMAMEDHKISGQVVWVGKSSIEVEVWLERREKGEWALSCKAYFVMVARNATNTGPAFVNPLIPATPWEEKVYQKALERAVKRSIKQDISLLKQSPSNEESKLIHQMFMEMVDTHDPNFHRSKLPPDSIWMEDTKMSLVLFPHPEDRNHYNTVFGGYLMRVALELAWMISYYQGGNRPNLLHISHITFKKPVHIGTLIRMTGQVVYSKNKSMQISVQADMLGKPDEKPSTSNVFFFTYKSPHKVKTVLPHTYHDAMIWLEGKRQYEEVTENNKDIISKNPSFPSD